jgi:hypothetical protein
MITQSELKSQLHYNQETGIFTWIKSKRSDVVGKQAGSYLNGYLKVKINQSPYYLHRLAWLYTYGKWPKNEIDHINGIKADNRIKNLRDVSASMNQENHRKPQVNNKSGYLGVSWRTKFKKWRAVIRVNKKHKEIGMYDTPEEAYKAYLKAKREYHKGCTL